MPWSPWLWSSGKYTLTLKEGYSLSVGEDGEVTVRTPEEGGQDSQAAQAPQESGTTGGVLDLPLLDGTAPQQQPVQSQNQAQSAGGRGVPGLLLRPLTDEHSGTMIVVPCWRPTALPTSAPEYVEPINPILSVLLSWVLPMVLIMVVFSLLMRGMAGKMGGGIGNLGKSNAKVYVERKTGVTFKDVAGQDEAKESLVEIIDFLHNPQKYTEIGAKLPKGALLVGPPGTGKTLLAKAVAGEANVPFFSISGSDFVEMFVGMGAARVRDLFKEANKMAPCIVFIDGIDTIGKSRDNRMGGNDEREQTLNQLLAEMDGFDPTKGVILLAATNRPEVLDQALLRPGRFDRRIIVDRPNLAGRLATLQVHTRNIRLAEDVNLRKIAIATAGTVGADLANLVNEAALRAVRLGRKAVNQEDLLAAFELVIAGAEKKGSVLSEFEKKLVAYHEVGHAMVAYRQKHAEPVSKITIVPHTQGALGYTLHLPEEDKHLHTRDELLAQITVSMGGRVAEELVLHTMTNGAAQDIQGRHRHRPQHGGHVRHERRVRHDGPGLPPQPVPGRRLRHRLRPGHRRRHGPGGAGSSSTPATRRQWRSSPTAGRTWTRWWSTCWRRRPSPARRWWLFWRAATLPWRTTSPTRTGKERSGPRQSPSPTPSPERRRAPAPNGGGMEFGPEGQAQGISKGTPASPRGFLCARSWERRPLQAGGAI